MNKNNTHMFKSDQFKVIFYKLMGLAMGIGWIALATLSTWQTILFFQTAGRGALGILGFIAGMAMDFGQYGFPVTAEIKRVQGEKHIWGWYVAMLVCFVMSIITSIGVDLNESNYIANNQGSTVVKTEAGSKQNAVLSAKSSEAKSIQTQLDSKLASYNADCKAVDQKYAARLKIANDKHYITTPAQNGYEVSVSGINVLISKEKKALDAAIEKLRGELSAANNGAVAENDKLTKLADGLLPTEGAESFISAVMKATGCKDREKVNIIFWIIKEFLFQAFAILFSRGFVTCFLLSPSPSTPNGEKRKLSEKISDAKDNLIDFSQRKKSPITDHKKSVDGQMKNKISRPTTSKFKRLRSVDNGKKTFLNVEITEDTLSYARAVKSTTPTDGICISYQKIGNHAGITSHKASKEKAKLETMKILKVIGAQTKVINYDLLDELLKESIAL